MTPTVTPAQLKAMERADREYALLDVRETGDFSQGHLFFAVSLPLGLLEVRLALLVPRRATPVVLCDGGEGLAQQAAASLTAWGYSQVSVLQGGVPAWAAAGFEVYSGVHVPSKAFGEVVEHACETPSLEPRELKALMDSGRDMVVLDSRPLSEYRVMSIPGAINVPGAELVYRARELAPNPETLVVVNCAGRTRSIIGAQSLRYAGLPNPVRALRNGTMGWHLAGLTLEHGQSRCAPEPKTTLKAAQAASQQVARAAGVNTVSLNTLEEWLAASAERTTYLLDVRHPEEYEAGHLPQARPAPGGQLVQATDLYVATRNARLVLVDDTGVRARMTASWLRQMGWRDTHVLEGGLWGDWRTHAPQGASGLPRLERGPWKPEVLGTGATDNFSTLTPQELAGAMAEGAAAVLDLADSLTHKSGHIPGAWFARRLDLKTALSKLPKQGRVVMTSPDGLLACVAAPEAASVAGGRNIALLKGGTEAWRRAGLSLETGLPRAASEPRDVYLRPYERDSGVENAMKDYLSWEVDLLKQIQKEIGVKFFTLPTPC
ncbi:MAG: rhodanese-like domain-containing protein [Deltaproteobacteria bacterium]|nr:rhodanese-like domain-containing protein [Deltaproteobacteria bacterium]